MSMFTYPTVERVDLQAVYAIGTGAPGRPGAGNLNRSDPDPAATLELYLDRFDARLVRVDLESIRTGWVYLTDGNAWEAYLATSVTVDTDGYATLEVVYAADESSGGTIVDASVAQVVTFREELLDNELVSPTYGLRIHDSQAPRYGDLETIKARVGISGTEWDTELLQALLAAEVALDEALGRSFPDAQPFGEVFNIPAGIVQAAENIAVAIFKALDAPGGQAGSDDWFGELDLSEQARREVRRSATMLGYRRRFGVG